MKEIQQNGTKEKEVIQELQKEDGQAWENNGIVYIDGWIYISNNKKIQKQILQENHNVMDVGHPGQRRMLELIKWNYWWPEIKEDIKSYIQGCFKYQQNKVQHQKRAGELHSLAVS